MDYVSDSLANGRRITGEPREANGDSRCNFEPPALRRFKVAASEGGVGKAPTDLVPSCFLALRGQRNATPLLGVAREQCK